MLGAVEEWLRHSGAVSVSGPGRLRRLLSGDNAVPRETPGASLFPARRGSGPRWHSAFGLLPAAYRTCGSSVTSPFLGTVPARVWRHCRRTKPAQDFFGDLTGRLYHGPRRRGHGSVAWPASSRHMTIGINDRHLRARDDNVVHADIPEAGTADAGGAWKGVIPVWGPDSNGRPNTLRGVREPGPEPVVHVAGGVGAG